MRYLCEVTSIAVAIVCSRYPGDFQATYFRPVYVRVIFNRFFIRQKQYATSATRNLSFDKVERVLEQIRLRAWRTKGDYNCSFPAFQNIISKGIILNSRAGRCSPKGTPFRAVETTISLIRYFVTEIINSVNSQRHRYWAGSIRYRIMYPQRRPWTARYQL